MVTRRITNCLHVQGDEDRLYQIYTVTSDGRNRKKVASPIGAARGPVVWSPDSRRLAFIGLSNIVYTLGVDSSELTMVGTAVTRPTWSPDSTHLAFVGPDGDALAVYVAATDGSNLSKVFEIYDERNFTTKPFYYVSWSPDGTKLLLFGGASNVSTVNVDGTNLRALTTGGFHSGKTHASWSSDGSRIAIIYPGMYRGPEFRLLTTKSDGSELRVLARRGEKGLISESDRRDLSEEVEACSRIEPATNSRSSRDRKRESVRDSEENFGLEQDCKTILQLGGAFAGYSAWFWSHRKPITEWKEVVIGGPVESQSRVQELVIAERGLNGTIPPGLEKLRALEVLVLANNRLSGTILRN